MLHMQGSFNGTLQIVSQADIQTPSKGPRWLGQATANRIALITPISVARWLLVLIGIAAIYFFHGVLVPVRAAPKPIDRAALDLPKKPQPPMSTNGERGSARKRAVVSWGLV